MDRTQRLMETVNALIARGPSARGRRAVAEAIAAAARANQGNGKRRKPPEAGIAVPAIPPNGPLPKTGGGEAQLEFD
ncbi:hypothetical protein [Parerythrobacter lacustris]|uniref:Uncharacterized protein n=1 Tax=Parerythrobacter lacustris TaxID=2969984 RepID=A0ABT1XKZ0_9SPHN|nr:hypothetical protein [Parerythrobacter lacustris]MCR2832333.1 hypothetical protein [Parerythrobacter lacustris]